MDVMTLRILRVVAEYTYAGWQTGSVLGPEHYPTVSVQSLYSGTVPSFSSTMNFPVWTSRYSAIVLVGCTSSLGRLGYAGSSLRA